MKLDGKFTLGLLLLLIACGVEYFFINNPWAMKIATLGTIFAGMGSFIAANYACENQLIKPGVVAMWRWIGGPRKSAIFSLAAVAVIGAAACLVSRQNSVYWPGVITTAAATPAVIFISGLVGVHMAVKE